MLPLLWLSACAADRLESPSFLVQDSAGVRVTASTAPVEPNVLVVDTVPAVEIRSDFDEPDHFLFSVNDVVSLPDGRLVVGNRGSSELFFFDAAGRFEFARGGQGDGPGELGAVYGMARCPNGRVVIEEVRRLSVFDPDGELVETVPITGHLADFRARVLGLSADCASVLLRVQTREPSKPTDEVIGPPLTFYWAAFSDGKRDTVAVIPELQARRWEIGEAVGSVPIPYGRRSVADASGAGLIVGEAEKFEIRRLDRSGKVIAVIRWAAQPEPVTADDWSDWQSAYETYLRDRPEQANIRPKSNFFAQPELKPTYATLMAGPAERVWVQRYGGHGPFSPEPSDNWWVFASDGRWLAEVTMPPGLEVVEITDTHVVGIYKDDLDVEHVRLHLLPAPLGARAIP